MQISAITDNDGNKPNTTIAIVEDHQGFIWLGATDGLYLYDGFNCKIFRNRPDDKNSLSNNTIWGLGIDKEGIIRIATKPLKYLFQRFIDIFLLLFEQ